MSTLAFTLAGLSAFAPQDAAGGAPAADAAAKAELVALAKKLEQASSYTFTYKNVINGKDDEAGAEPVRGGARRDVWTVQFERDRPTHLVKGHADFFRNGSRYVALGQNDEWSRVELPPRIEGEPPSRERLRGLARMVFELDRLPLPHELVAGLDGMVEEVTRAEQDGRIEYVATLGKKTVREMMSGGRGVRGAAGRKRSPAQEAESGESGGKAESGRDTAGDGSAPHWAGTLRVLAAGGVIERIEIDLLSRTATGERTVRREFGLSAVNATTVYVPEPAAEVLAEDE